jgi:DNA polymerase kappa
VVYEMSKDSPFYAEAQRRDAVTEERCVALQARLASLPRPELAAAERTLAQRRRELEATRRDLSRAWICVDMDAFFAACEIRDNPALADVPMAVGGIGMISTSNYVARRFGVRAAMPGFIAKRLCPALVLVESHFDKYEAAAEQTRKVFAQYDAEFISGSLDEAFLDVTDYCAKQGCTPAEAAERLRAQVHAETRLTCSAGVAPNRMLAKIASDINKPNGQFVLPPSTAAVLAFLEQRPVRKLPGIGRVTEKLLAACGAVTCGDVLQRAPALSLLLSRSNFEFVFESSLGNGETARPAELAPGEAGRKGMSVERTFNNMSDQGALERKLRELAAALSEHLSSEGLRARQVTLKLKTVAFEVRTRTTPLTKHTCAEEDLFAPALRLLRAELPIEIRLMGLRASNFMERRPPPPGQTTLSFRSDNAAAEPGTFACDRCGAIVAESARAEHDDFHVARELQRQMREEEAAAVSKAAKASSASKRPPPRESGSIQALFKRAAGNK